MKFVICIALLATILMAEGGRGGKLSSNIRKGKFIIVNVTYFTHTHYKNGYNMNFIIIDPVLVRKGRKGDLANFGGKMAGLEMRKGRKGDLANDGGALAGLGPLRMRYRG